jgi:hypothetical protein
VTRRRGIAVGSPAHWQAEESFDSDVGGTSAARRWRGAGTNMVAELTPIGAAELPAVASFLHRHLNSRVPAQAWRRAVEVPWSVDAPNHGFCLRDGNEVVGAYLAYYSDREINGQTERFCNLGAWCVLEEHRFRGLRLLTALLGQDGYHFTDLSPSGAVVALNQRMKFTELDTTTMLIPNVPLPLRAPRCRIDSDPNEIEDRLSPADLRVYQDHRGAAAARHVVLTAGSDSCYVVFRKDTRKRVRAFASILHVTDHELFRRVAPRLGAQLLIRHGAAATLVERRVAGGRPAGSLQLTTARPKMFKSASLAPEQIDYLYSELTCLEW